MALAATKENTTWKAAEPPDTNGWRAIRRPASPAPRPARTSPRTARPGVCRATFFRSGCFRLRGAISPFLVQAFPLEPPPFGGRGDITILQARRKFPRHRRTRFFLLRAGDTGAITR